MDHKKSGKKESGERVKTTSHSRIVKSPSDTTLYTPALKQTVQNTLVSPSMDRNGLPAPKFVEDNECSAKGESETRDFTCKLTDQIVHFIEGIHFQDGGSHQGSSRNNDSQNQRADQKLDKFDEVKRKSEKLVVDAEHF